MDGARARYAQKKKERQVESDEARKVRMKELKRRHAKSTEQKRTHDERIQNK